MIVISDLYVLGRELSQEVITAARDYILNTIINGTLQLRLSLDFSINEWDWLLKDGKIVRRCSDIRYESGESIDQLFRQVQA